MWVITKASNMVVSMNECTIPHGWGLGPVLVVREGVPFLERPVTSIPTGTTSPCCEKHCDKPGGTTKPYWEDHRGRIRILLLPTALRRKTYCSFSASSPSLKYITMNLGKKREVEEWLL